MEASALCYLIAFDLDRFDLGYALGTEHPRVGWSEHMLEQMRDPALARAGWHRKHQPADCDRSGQSRKTPPKTVATFTGGFKRDARSVQIRRTGAARITAAITASSKTASCSANFSRVWRRFLCWTTARCGMKTWTEADNRLLAQDQACPPERRAADRIRQGSRGPAPGRSGQPVGTGQLVRFGGREAAHDAGRRGRRRTNHGKRFLIYAVFSDATPSAMARIFQAYRCDYAMLLDMNALEHTYLALYRRSGSQMFVDHLLKGMSEVDKSAGGELVPALSGIRRTTGISFT